ncbi:MAG: type III-B CRISPR-associated protein Cas10/Cmr2 [Anaerolineales bacterium]|nr:type III-B CRISPR-associated protein Cas10/Cmr2 [Anaerolineales bacterium]
MTSSLLLFTFTPIQSFIQEARRAEDLFNGSAILSELAKAAALSIQNQGGELIYPSMEAEIDMPNVLVARFEESEPNDVGKTVKEVIQKQFEARWEEICNAALTKMTDLNVTTDKIWNDIWIQQVDAENLWEVYWAVAPLDKGYAEAYRQASRAVDALKRSRIFKPMEETGQKDSLSGKRAALHTAKHKKAKDYWIDLTEPGTDIFPSKVRPNGRERLDAIGAVKRFAELKNEPFDSTSTVAAADFLAKARADTKTELAAYHKLLQERFDEKEVFRPYKNVEQKKDMWSYDGDLLYDTTLTVQRFKSDYHFRFDDKDSQAKQQEKALANKLDECRDLLKGNKDKKIAGIYEKIGRPSSYYAIIVLDGDSMGAKIDALLKTEKPDEAHQEFSRRLGEFSISVKDIVANNLGFLVYNGGDDVMCMAPLSRTMPLAIALRRAFIETMKDFGATLSAGVAISHHQSPLDFAIEEARAAEKIAKNKTGRDAICVHALKRSGEPLEVRSKWGDMQTIVEELRVLFENGALSSRLAYSIQRETPILSGLPSQARKSMLKVLLTRQSTDEFKSQVEQWVNRLIGWADELDKYLPHKKDRLGNDEGPAGFAEMANWLLFTRFLSQGGGEQ